MAELEEILVKTLQIAKFLIKWAAIISGMLNIARIYLKGDNYGAIKAGLLSIAGLAMLLLYPKLVETVSSILS